MLNAVARRLLVGRAMPVPAIAETLHYSGACAFIRAFRGSAWRATALGPEENPLPS